MLHHNQDISTASYKGQLQTRGWVKVRARTQKEEPQNAIFLLGMILPFQPWTQSNWTGLHTPSTRIGLLTVNQMGGGVQEMSFPEA